MTVISGYLPSPEGQAALKAGFAEATSISGTPAGLPGAVAATGFGYAPLRRAEQVSRLSPVLQEFDDIRRMGSAAIDICLAAEGKGNAYFERGLGVYGWAG